MTEMYDMSFTGNDLRDKMVVEFRDCSRAMVVGNILLTSTGFIPMADFVSSTLRNRNSRRRDIVKVFGPILSLDLSGANELIWESRPVYRVTMAEVEERFGGKVEIISDGD